MRRHGSSFAATSVLVADDDEQFRRVVRGRLTKHGYEVLEADDGEAALGVLASGAEPDVVVLDVLMPRCSGLGVLEILRALRRAPPTLLMTGFEDRSIDLVGRRLGAVRVFHKPFPLDELLAGIFEAAKGDARGERGDRAVRSDKTRAVRPTSPAPHRARPRPPSVRIGRAS